MKLAFSQARLNNSIWASKLAPVRKLDKRYDSLYRIYKEHNGAIDTLVGKYIEIYLTKSDYGMDFNSIKSYDIVKDFKNLLDESQGKAFFTNMSIYGFLKQLKYQINPDDSITLKKPYDDFNIFDKDGITVCYPNQLKPDVLTLDNIGIIYKQFFYKKHSSTGHSDMVLQYKLKHVAIVENCKRYHRYKSKTISDHDTDVLRIGDNLNDEQLKFLSEKNHQD